MSITNRTHIVEVRGDFACFSRPEMKVERFSYPCPTPSAARGIFDAIYCKGWDRCTGDSQFYWQVEKIEILNKPEFIALRRNEVGSKMSVANVNKWIKGSVQPLPLMADDSTQRQQRQSIAIRNPKYRLHAHIVPREKYVKEVPAYNSQFERRAKQGKTFQQPYFGCREFVAYYRYLENLDNEPKAIDYSQDMGKMLYDVFDLCTVNNCYAKPYISVFQAEIKNGVLEIPPFESDMVLKPESAGRRGV